MCSTLIGCYTLVRLLSQAVLCLLKLSSRSSAILDRMSCNSKWSTLPIGMLKCNSLLGTYVFSSCVDIGYTGLEDEPGKLTYLIQPVLLINPTSLPYFQTISISAWEIGWKLASLWQLQREGLLWQLHAASQSEELSIESILLLSHQSICR